MTVTVLPSSSGSTCSLVKSNCYTKHYDALKVATGFRETVEISFQRTIRVPDGDGDSELPPSMGTFPMYSASEYEDKLPKPMASKGGVFLPMYRKS